MALDAIRILTPAVGARSSRLPLGVWWSGPTLRRSPSFAAPGARAPSRRMASQHSPFGPPSSMLGIPTAGGHAPSTYFQRPSLPANTVIRFVPQQTAWIVERMGRFHRILEPGLAILIPFLDRIAYVRSLKENAIEIPSQSAITADNVTLELDGVLYTRVFDAYKASYGVEDAEYAIGQLAQTTMRSEIGQLSLDHVLKERAALNVNITQAINEAAQEWGVVCLRYEIRDIHAPDGVVAAMHRQVTAERSKRAEILESEGQRQSAINIAEGRKQSIILASEANKAEQINSASGEAQAILLTARATAAAITAVADRIAAGQQSALAAVSLSVAEKYVDAFGRLAKEGTAVVVPANLGDLGGMIATAFSVYGTVTDRQLKAAAAAPPLTHPPAAGADADLADLADLPELEEPEGHTSYGDGAGMRSSPPEAAPKAGTPARMAQTVLDSFERSRRKR
ncbi:MAG: hypothetical protein M1826_000699 [Phylliscum demangeonii]|nr:MAG: hypothetical protein M1826_000699 [Phylliscum demangeonii]